MAKALTAVGITCGIGSMLVGAKKAGFNVLGNVEWRRYYFARDEQGRNTFEEYFKVPMSTNYDKPPENLHDPDLAMIHAECGGFSSLNAANNTKLSDPTDIPKAIELIAKLRPRFFVADNLPKSCIAVPISEYHRQLPEYDLYPEWVSNAAYGNVQKNRRRMFMIGALKTEGFAFRPGEANHTLQVKDILGDLRGKEGKIPNHHKHTVKGECPAARGLNGEEHASWKDIQSTFLANKPGYIWHYKAKDGIIKVKMGMSMIWWDGHSTVLTGTNPAHHPKTGLPLSIRERARIQGLPDDFVFYGEKLEEDGSWNHYRNTAMIKQTGKAMPIQFCEYASRQIKAHIDKKVFRTTDARVLKPDHYINEAKQWFCGNVGYANQKAACGSCWMKQHCTLERKSV